MILADAQKCEDADEKPSLRATVRGIVVPRPMVRPTARSTVWIGDDAMAVCGTRRRRRFRLRQEGGGRAAGAEGSRGDGRRWDFDARTGPHAAVRNVGARGQDRPPSRDVVPEMLVADPRASAKPGG